jgi:hypothetical protein
MSEYLNRSTESRFEVLTRYFLGRTEIKTTNRSQDGPCVVRI